MKITIARIRSFVNYKGPLETVLDSFFELYFNWMKTRPDLEFDTYNVSFDGTRPKRNLEALKTADVIIIPSDSEFRYWIPGSVHLKDLEKSQRHIEKMKPFIENKDIIMFRSDRGDDENLYRNYTFKNIKINSFTTIDEVDFPANIHGMKYHFIRKLKNPFIARKQDKDFAYWGNMKPKDIHGKTTGDERHIIIRQIYKDKDINQILIGYFPSGIKRDAKWIKKWRELLPYLERARCTICFNWLDPTATTSRYPEAIAVGLIPFVWKDYDKNNTYNLDIWQRVYDFDHLKEKMLELRKPKMFNELYNYVHENYKSILPTVNEYQEIFNSKMNEIIK